MIKLKDPDLEHSYTLVGGDGTGTRVEAWYGDMCTHVGRSGLSVPDTVKLLREVGFILV